MSHRAPPTQPDLALWPVTDFSVLVQAIRGARLPCAWYLNDDANIAYACRAPDGGRLSLPVLFVNGDYDQMNNIKGKRLATLCGRFVQISP